MLALLTLSGFILVSNLMGAKRTESNQPGAAAADAKSNSKRSIAIPPLPPPNYKPSQDEGQMHADLMRAQELLVVISASMAANNWKKAQ